MALYENYLICIFMNINENLRIRENPMDELASQEVIRHLLVDVNLFNVTTFMLKNIVLKDKCILVI